MLTLRRTVRANINPPEASRATPNGVLAPDECPNGFGGKPSSRGLARYYEFEVIAAGDADPETGYLVNIHVIDRAVRKAVVPEVARACIERPGIEPAALLAELVPPLERELRGMLRSIRWRVNPYYSVSMTATSHPDTTTRNRAYLRQRFDFAAAHRLNVPGMSADENRALFGKCNNPSGHGHNYQFEPCVAIRMDGEGGAFSLPDLERLADEAIVAHFDHRHLNLDTDEFREDGGLNPSVENIAKVFFERLAPRVAEASARAELVSMTVWETDRTCCTYPAEGPG